MKPFSTVSVVMPFKAIPLNEEFKLLPERFLAMMLMLICNVSCNLIDVRMRYRESSIATTPGEPSSQ